MLNRVKEFLLDRQADPAVAETGHTEEELRLAAAALLVEAARMDESFDGDERDRIVELVRWRFGLSGEEASLLVDRASQASTRATQLHGFAHPIREAFDAGQRIRLIEMMWDVACADGELHPMESHLIRRVGGLLFVDERDSGAARKRAMARHGLTETN